MSKRRLRVDSFARQNITAARLIVGESERYGGEGAGLVIWARLVIEKGNRDAGLLPFSD